MNKVELIGFLTKKPETRQVGSDTVTTFTVATSESWKDKATGEKKEKSEFHICNFWGKSGEAFGKYHNKGDRVFVEGSIENGSYEKDGVKHYTTKMKIKKFEFIKDKNSRNDSQAQRNSAPQDNLPSRDINSDVDDQSELPF